MVDNISAHNIKFGAAAAAPATPAVPEGYTMNPDPFIKLETAPDTAQFTTNAPPEEKKSNHVLLKVLVAAAALLGLSAGSGALAKKLATSETSWLTKDSFINNSLEHIGKLWKWTKAGGNKVKELISGKTNATEVNPKVEPKIEGAPKVDNPEVPAPTPAPTDSNVTT